MTAPFRAWAKRDWKSYFSRPWVKSIESKNKFKVSNLKGQSGKYYGYLEFTFNDRHLISVTITELELETMLNTIKRANQCIDTWGDLPWG